MKCNICGAKLAGISSKGAKTTNRPTRKYAGHLCHECIRKIEKAKVRLEAKSITEDDIDPRIKNYM